MIFFFNASFPKEEVEKESNVICEEIKMYKDNPHLRVMETIKKIYMKVRLEILLQEHKKNVKGMTREQYLINIEKFIFQVILFFALLEIMILKKL